MTGEGAGSVEQIGRSKTSNFTLLIFKSCIGENWNAFPHHGRFGFVRNTD